MYYCSISHTPRPALARNQYLTIERAPVEKPDTQSPRPFQDFSRLRSTLHPHHKRTTEEANSSRGGPTDRVSARPRAQRWRQSCCQSSWGTVREMLIFLYNVPAQIIYF